MNGTEIVLRDNTRVLAGKLPATPGGFRGRVSRMAKAAGEAYQQGGIPRAIAAAYDEWQSPLPPMPATVPAGTETRVLDFPVGYNIAYVPRSYEGVGFAQLREMADSDYIARACIETVKDQISKLDWRIGVVPKTDEPHTVARRRGDADPRVKKYTEFFKCPDGRHDFHDWLRMLMEDNLVIDAPTLLVGREDGGRGKIASLVPADGAMMHVCIDKRGMIPDPPLPYLQQVARGQIVANLTTSDVVYMPRNVRSSRVYGMSPVEQALFFMNIVLRRDITKLSYYTAGNVPEALISAPNSWSPEQITQFNQNINAVLAGNLQKRNQMTMIPSLAEPGKSSNIRDAVLFTKDKVLQDEFDEWRARVTCYFFNLPPTSFVKMNNRATGQQQQKQALEEGLYPRRAWIKSKMDNILQSKRYFGEADLEFAWEDEQEVDPEVQAAVDKIDVSVGLRSIDELRVRDGLEPFGIGPLIITATGPIMLEDLKGKDAPGRVLPNKPKPITPAFGPDGKPLPNGAAPATGKQAGKAANDAVEKMLKAASLKKKVTISADSAKLPDKTKRNVLAASKSIARFLKKQGSQLASKAAEEYSHFRKANESDEQQIQQILDELDLDWVAVTGFMERPMTEAGRESAASVLLEMGFDDAAGEIFGVVNQDALNYAIGRAAEMVGKKFVNGELVDNPDARWAITDTTRGELKDLITKAFKDGMSPAQLEDAIGNSFQFSSARADMIASTEMSKAHTEGAVNAAKASGLVEKKYSLLSNDHDQDDECDDNADEGQILLGDDFPSGDSAPPFHPNCNCTLSFVYVTGPGEGNA